MIYTATQNLLINQHKELADALESLKGGQSESNGMTPDHIKRSPEFQLAWKRERAAFKAVQIYNTSYKKQLTAERKAQA